MNKSLYSTLLILLCSFSLVFAMGGGGGGGSSAKNSRALEGKITDQNGDKLKGVEITLFRVEAADVEQAKMASEGEKMLSTITGGNGKYRFVAVRPGFYRVRIALDGYQTLEKLMEFKRSGKDAVLNVEIRQITAEMASPAGTQH